MTAEREANRHYRGFEFNLRELAGSMGDFGIHFPLEIGFIAANACIRRASSSSRG